MAHEMSRADQADDAEIARFRDWGGDVGHIGHIAVLPEFLASGWRSTGGS
jgi:hypothetical protein